MNLLRRLRPESEDLAKFGKIAAKVWADKEWNSEKEIRRLSSGLQEQKDLKHKLLLVMLGGAVKKTDYTEANERFDAEIAVIEQELQFIGSRRGTQQSFVLFAEVLLMDIDWPISSPTRNAVSGLKISLRGRLELRPGPGNFEPL